ncbi:MAG: alpha/beta hydrolase family protein [Candidatus Obscuribacterales bacterium]|nr:alpha/beta hydrolase family protein [Candidatus Obscuribacterales bacterium]
MSNNRTDKDIEAEAKLALNQVINLHRGIAAQKIRPELRKAFPFGPAATAKERAIWESTMRLAMEELQKWPVPVLVALIIACCNPAFAADYVNDGKVWYQVTDFGKTQTAVPADQVPLKKRLKHGCKKTVYAVRRGC